MTRTALIIAKYSEFGGNHALWPFSPKPVGSGGGAGGQKRRYLFNEEAFALLEGFGLSKKVRAQLQELALDQEFDEEQMEALLKEVYPKAEQGKNNRRRIKEAGVIAAYHQQTDYPVVEILLSDDAPQYKQLTQYQALCWIHDGRHYKKFVVSEAEPIEAGRTLASGAA